MSHDVSHLKSRSQRFVTLLSVFFLSKPQWDYQFKYERKNEKDPGRSTCSKMTSSCKCLQMQIVQMFIVFYCLLINPTTYLQQRA